MRLIDMKCRECPAWGARTEEQQAEAQERTLGIATNGRCRRYPKFTDRNDDDPACAEILVLCLLLPVNVYAMVTKEIPDEQESV